MSNIFSFNDAVNNKWQADFKARWQSKTEGPGEYTQDIWDWEKTLIADGWHVELYSKETKLFSTFVDFENKILHNNNIKAYHAMNGMKAALQKLSEGVTGRWVFYWDEVHDEAHKHVRNSAEWEGTDWYGTVWYSMELYEMCLRPDQTVDAIPTNYSREGL